MVTPDGSDKQTDAQSQSPIPRDMAIKTHSQQPPFLDEELLPNPHPHKCMLRHRHQHQLTYTQTLMHPQTRTHGHTPTQTCMSQCRGPRLGSRVRLRSECKNRAVCLSYHTVGYRRLGRMDRPGSIQTPFVHKWSLCSCSVPGPDLGTGDPDKKPGCS